MNWEVLPPGRRTWAEVKSELEVVVRAAPGTNQPVIEYRLEKVNRYQPEFVAIGRAGFRGYLIFGFPEKNLYVLESAYTGNATYVFAERWEQLSKRTKAEILSEGLQVRRIIHRDGWESEIDSLLK